MRLTEAVGLAEAAIAAEDEAALADAEARLKEYYKHVLDEKTVSLQCKKKGASHAATR